VTTRPASQRAPTAWRFDYRPAAALPPLAWGARLAGGAAVVDCGVAVRCTADGFFEGSWAGGAELAAIPAASTVVGSGIVADGARALVVTPSHTLEGIFFVRSAGTLVLANTLAGLLEACALELDPNVRYPPLFGQINQGIRRALIELPTSGPPIEQLYFHNLAVTVDGATAVSAKPAEPPFSTFAEYRDLLVVQTRSVFANAPGYTPVVALSSGYDSTAVAAVGTAAGLRRAASLRDGVAWRGYGGTSDSGARAAQALGLALAEFDRLAYLAADDLPEAELLANGMSGEDIVLRSLEPELHRSILLSGFWGGAAWRGPDRSELKRTDLSGTSLTEMRLRLDFIHLPVPYLGGLQQPTLARLRLSDEMRPFSVGGVYDEPVARRLAEEAGVPRGAFATTKLATSRRFHIEGLAGLSRAARADLERFAGADALRRLPPRPPFDRRHRLAIRLAKALRVPRLVAGLEQRGRAAVHIEPVLGSLLLRWALSVVRPRYRSLRRD
jgi:hypothetical protein